jgi:hypothetical protein
MAAFAKSWRRELRRQERSPKRCLRKIQLLALWINVVPPCDGSGERPAIAEGLPKPAVPGNPS